MCFLANWNNFLFKSFMVCTLSGYEKRENRGRSGKGFYITTFFLPLELFPFFCPRSYLPLDLEITSSKYGLVVYKLSLCLPANNILLMFICLLALLWEMEIAPLSFQERELCSYEKQNCRLNDKNNFQTQIRQNILIRQCLTDPLTCPSHELGQIINFDCWSLENHSICSTSSNDSCWLLPFMLHSQGNTENEDHARGWKNGPCGLSYKVYPSS